MGMSKPLTRAKLVEAILMTLGALASIVALALMVWGR
jgi:hypothetical protein